MVNIIDKYVVSIRPDIFHDKWKNRNVEDAHTKIERQMGGMKTKFHQTNIVSEGC